MVKESLRLRKNSCNRMANKPVNVQKGLGFIMFSDKFLDLQWKNAWLVHPISIVMLNIRNVAVWNRMRSEGKTNLWYSK